MDNKNSDLDLKDAEDMTQDDWEKLAACESGYKKIAEKIKWFFRLFDTPLLCSNVEEVKDKFKEAFKDLSYPKPLESFELQIEKGLIYFSGSIPSPINNSPIYFSYEK